MREGVLVSFKEDEGGKRGEVGTGGARRGGRAVFAGVWLLCASRSLL